MPSTTPPRSSGIAGAVFVPRRTASPTRYSFSSTLKARSACATVPDASTDVRFSGTDETVNPSEESQDRTRATASADGENRARNRDGLRKCPYDRLCGSET